MNTNYVVALVDAFSTHTHWSSFWVYSMSFITCLTSLYWTLLSMIFVNHHCMHSYILQEYHIYSQSIVAWNTHCKCTLFLIYHSHYLWLVYCSVSIFTTFLYITFAHTHTHTYTYSPTHTHTHTHTHTSRSMLHVAA